MFTGIIEESGIVEKLVREGENLHITLSSGISDQLKIDQSVAHDGICLTVVDVVGKSHTVTAISETINRTNLHQLKVGSKLNLERAMLANARLDGHIVQGHVDSVAYCEDIKEAGGSWYFYFKFKEKPKFVLVDKGSVCINGVSLTVVNPSDMQFCVAIIPYTMEHTNFGTIKIGDAVNIEFDIIGKYVSRMMEAYQ